MTNFDKIVKYMYIMKSDKYQDKFINRCTHGDYKAIEYFLKHEKNTETRSRHEIGLYMACKNGYLNIIKLLCSHHNMEKFIKSKNVLEDICTGGHIKILKWIYDVYTTKNIDVERLFQISIKYEQLEMAEFIFMNDRTIPVRFCLNVIEVIMLGNEHNIPKVKNFLMKLIIKYNL